MSIEFEQHNAAESELPFEYIKYFDIHYSLLLRRYERFREINKIQNHDIDVITYFDMIVVQLRAMCIENDRLKKNYTAQILLRKLNKPKLADELDAMLNEEFMDGFTDFTIRNALKFLADGFICHYDNIDKTEKNGLGLAIIIEKQLKNPITKSIWSISCLH